MEYTLTDAAKLVRLNKSTLFRAIKAGRLSARREEGGTYLVDASELARVYGPQHVPRNDDKALHSAAMGEATPAMAATVGELALQRARMLEDVLAREREERERERGRWDQERETILERERETVDDLRKRLDRAEERVLALTAQPAPSTPQPAQEPPVGVEELRRRLEASEAHVRALVTAAPPAPQAAQERPSEAPAGVTTAGVVRGLLGRLLGR